MQKNKLIRFDISLGSYSAFVDEIILQASSAPMTYYVCVANVHMMIEACQSDSYTQILNGADMVTPDGQPLVWALRLLYGISQERVAGMDLLPDLLLAAEKQRVPVAFYGGTQDMLNKAHVRIEKTYPNMIVAKMFSPPFRPLTSDEEDSIAKMLNNSGARLIFVALGCPKQEIWMASMKNRIHAVMIGIGGALPVLAGIQKRAPVWMQRSGLEWLYRLGQEPGRLFKRYATTNFSFIYLVLREKFSAKKNANEKISGK